MVRYGGDGAATLLIEVQWEVSTVSTGPTVKMLIEYGCALVTADYRVRCDVALEIMLS